MMERILDLPLVAAVGVLWVIVLCRAGATYALGRLAGTWAQRGRIGAFLEGPRVSRAQESVRRWGAPVVAVSFLTVGFQTAMNAAAGLTRMPLTRYVPALVVGGFAWAVLYATIGLAAFVMWLELSLLSPWAAVAGAVLLVVVIAMLVRRRLSSRAQAPAPADPSAGEHRSPRRSDDRAARTR